MNTFTKGTIGGVVGAGTALYLSSLLPQISPEQAATPTLLARTPIPTIIRLGWNINPEPNISSYKVYEQRDGVFTHLTTTPKSSVTFAITETTTFTITAINTKGLESTMSEPLTINLESSIDLSEWNVPDKAFFRTTY